MFKDVLNRRYQAESKLLDLGALAQDPKLAQEGVFSEQAESKFFTALMVIGDREFKSAKDKREALRSVSLANNGLKSVEPVKALAVTFPDIVNLDLSGNDFQDLSALQLWKNKFRHLDLLVLPPMGRIPPADLRLELLRWYPRLRLLNGEQIRSDEEAASAGKTRRNGFPIRASIFQDESQIAENFIKQFFIGIDTDRKALAEYFYDSTSKFSYSINTHAPRDPNDTNAPQRQEWDAWIRHSRNLKHITHLAARMDRNYIGTDRIAAAYNTLPATRHPDLASNPNKWLFECHPIPGVPDPSGQSNGVGGFLITVHGEFDEMDVSTGQSKKHRSFDRTFVIGPGGQSGVRIVSDMWTIRAYGGYEAFKPEEQNSVQQIHNVDVPLPTNVPVQQNAAPIEQSTGMAAEQEKMVAEVTRLTNMKPEFSMQCLVETNWNFEGAMAAFNSARAEGKIPASSFLS